MSALEIPTPWEIVEDSQGFSNIHHPREDGHLGDIVATCFQDERHAAMLRAAPEMLAALRGLRAILDTAESNASGNPEWRSVSKAVNAARKATADVEGLPE